MAAITIALWLSASLCTYLPCRAYYAEGKLDREDGVPCRKVWKRLMLGIEPASRQPILAPWQARHEQDALWLQGMGFRPKQLLEPDWTPHDRMQLEDAIAALAAGDLQKESEDMATAYWLSHHIMSRKYSERGCQRMLNVLERELCKLPKRLVPPADLSEPEASEASEAGGSSEESEDEVTEAVANRALHRGL